MSEQITMPALGESVTEGTVTRWLKEIGEEVAVDEPLLEVSTDKVDTEVPSPISGTLLEILVAEDETVAVGAVLATVGAAGEAPAPSTSAPASAPVSSPAPPQAAPAPPAPAPAPAPTPAQGSVVGTEILMPALGESVTEGTVTRWLKQLGETVTMDEPLLEVSTDKVDTEVPSPVAGTILEICASEDDVIAVGGVLAIVGSERVQGQLVAAPPAPPVEPPPAAVAPLAPPVAAPPAAVAPPLPPVAAPPVAVPPTPDPRPSVPATGVSGASGYLTPLVRKLAAEKGIDVTTLTGTGVGGRIRKEDVLEAAARAEAQAKAAAQAAAQAAAPAPKTAATPPVVSQLRGTTEKLSRLRKIVAERMVSSLHTMAQLTTVVEVDVTKVAALRTRAKDAFAAREGAKLTYLPFFTLAAIEALKIYPKINATITDTEVIYHGQENVGIAVDTERGLVVPVIKGAGDLNLSAIARAIGDLGARTRANKVGPDELSGGTFTITNTGSGGALFDTPIVPSPQVAIMGTGSIIKRPMVVTGPDGVDAIAVRHMCYLSLSYDHRLVDGADAARFLMTVKQRIEEGAFEAELGLA